MIELPSDAYSNEQFPTWSRYYDPDESLEDVLGHKYVDIHGLLKPTSNVNWGRIERIVYQTRRDLYGMTDYPAFPFPYSWPEGARESFSAPLLLPRW